jgi:hypothetical protein
MRAHGAARLTAVAAALVIFAAVVLAVVPFEPGAIWDRGVVYVFTM